MRDIGEITDSTRISEVVAPLKGRKLPLIHEKANIEKVIDAMIRFEHSRLLYVVDDDEKLTGTISLGILIRHVFPTSYEPQIHPRFIINMITAETAKDIMQKNPIVSADEEKVAVVLRRMIMSNAKEIPVLDKEKRVVADLTMVDLLKFLLN
ncbi:MAG: CBS domain-containing protein [Deltaproteobacteria bacterium]|nr:CBS domain-containing protein [Deltaproteobacteria bacterium]